MGEFLRDLWQFMRMRKKYWLLPIILVLMLLGGLVVVSQQSALASLIYTVFLAQHSSFSRAYNGTPRGATRVCSGLIFCVAPCKPAGSVAFRRNTTRTHGRRGRCATQ